MCSQDLEGSLLFLVAHVYRIGEILRIVCYEFVDAAVVVKTPDSLSASVEHTCNQSTNPLIFFRVDKLVAAFPRN